MKKIIPFVLLLVVVVGCRAKLNDESSTSVELMNQVFRTVDPISKAQKIHVNATASSGQINVYVFLKKDQAEVVKEVERSKPSTKILAQELKTAKATLSAEIPAKEEAVVMIMSADGKKADVKLKINN